MTRNRFEQVDEVQPDAITISLGKGDAGLCLQVHCPAALSGGRLAEDTTSRDMPLIEGFRSAVKLANEIKAPLVVIDPDGLWMPEWGTLYRAD